MRRSWARAVRTRNLRDEDMAVRRHRGVSRCRCSGREVRLRHAAGPRWHRSRPTASVRALLVSGSGSVYADRSFVYLPSVAVLFAPFTHAGHALYAAVAGVSWWLCSRRSSSPQSCWFNGHTLPSWRPLCWSSSCGARLWSRRHISRTSGSFSRPSQLSLLPSCGGRNGMRRAWCWVRRCS